MACQACNTHRFFPLVFEEGACSELVSICQVWRFLISCVNLAKNDYNISDTGNHEVCVYNNVVTKM